MLAVTACPTGIAHTFMAAEAIEDAAKKRGFDVKVETRGSVGVENDLTASDIKDADAIILACDTAVPTERFNGKKVLQVGVSDALKDANGLIDRALNAPVFGVTVNLADQVAQLKEQRSTQRTGVYKHLMNGVSFMIPFVVAGGIAIALSFLIGGYKGFEVKGSLAAWMMGIGGAAADPLRVIPSIMAGSAVTGALSMLFNCTLSVPHGGLFVFFAASNIPMYLISIAAGTVVTALLVGFLKKPVPAVE